MPHDDKLTVGKVIDWFLAAYEWKRDFLERAKEDFEFTLGKQWDTKDVVALNAIGVKALTINKIRPNIRLLKGIESQNRSDFKAFPEGREDAISAEIATRLLKNIVKNNDIDFLLSEVFEDGNTCGESSIEPFLDFPYTVKQDGSVDLNAKLKTKKADYYNIFPEPGFKDYDMDDAAFVCKITYDVPIDQLISMFPNKEKELNNLDTGMNKFAVDRINRPLDQSGAQPRTTNYEGPGSQDPAFRKERVADLLDYYYKRFMPHWFVGNVEKGIVKKAESEKEAKGLAESMNVGRPAEEPVAKAFKRMIPEMWVAFVVSGLDKFAEHGLAWSFPRWNGYPFMTYFAERSTTDLDEKDRHLAVQGITRGVKDLNLELNKRRTQELRHLNQSANSGWISEEGAWTDPEIVKKFGSAPGVDLHYRVGKQKPERITPMPLSQGHAQLAAEHSQDIKEELGINTDLLAQAEGGQASGRAIALRQKQGLVMVQGYFDNFSRTKRKLGRFILSQFSEVYDTEKAFRVLGESFITENFQVPVTDASGAPVADEEGNIQTQVSEELAMQTISKVLVDSKFGEYDVEIGESVSNETIQFGNTVFLMDLAKEGFPIPPDVLIEESSLPEGSKKKILTSLAAAKKEPPKGD